MKPTRHIESGLSLKMDFQPRPDGKAVIDIIWNGDYESAIVSGPALAFAKEAYSNRDIDAYIALWRVNCGLAEQREAA